MTNATTTLRQSDLMRMFGPEGIEHDEPMSWWFEAEIEIARCLLGVELGASDTDERVADDLKRRLADLQRSYAWHRRASYVRTRERSRIAPRRANGRCRARQRSHRARRARPTKLGDPDGEPPRARTVVAANGGAQ